MQTPRPPHRNRRTPKRNVYTIGQVALREIQRDRTAQSTRSNSVGTAHEQHPQSRNRDNKCRIGLF